MKFKALKAAFPHTIPILAGFWFLGMAYGLYMKVSGFSFLYPFLMSIVIFGGSLEFVCVEMLLSPFAPLQVFIMALLIQARHLFYGLSMLEKYKGTGAKKWYLIYGLCDETFSVNYSADIPADVDRNWFMFFVTILDQLYWVLGATTGAILGGFIKFDTAGIDFILTAMFIVIFLEQWLKEKNHISAYIGLIASVVCLNIFGPDSFMIPTMIAVITVLALLKKPLTKLEAKETEVAK